MTTKSLNDEVIVVKICFKVQVLVYFVKSCHDLHYELLKTQ